MDIEWLLISSLLLERMNMGRLEVVEGPAHRTSPAMWLATPGLTQEAGLVVASGLGSLVLDFCVLT